MADDTAIRGIALVIGNGRYGEFGDLPNAARDADLVGNKFHNLGYEIIVRVDRTGREIESDVLDLVDRLSKVQADAALVFFAGHGFQEGGANYILGVPDANCRAEPISLQRLIERLTTTGRDPLCRRRLVFLDACRSSLARDRLAEQLAPTRTAAGGALPVIELGLAELDYGSQTLQSFSAAPGKPALDAVADSGNSPFAEALVRNLGVADLNHGALLGRVSEEVSNATGQKQIPHATSTLSESYFFNPKEQMIFIANGPSILAVLVALGIGISAALQVGAGEGRSGVLLGAIGLLLVALAILFFGFGRVYGFARRGRTEDGGLPRPRDGAIGGVLMGVIGGPIVTLPYWYDWMTHPTLIELCDFALWYQPELFWRCPRLATLLVEITIAGIFISVPLGVLSVAVSNRLARSAAAGKDVARAQLVGATLGGVLTGGFVAPIVTMYFGRYLQRPFVEPGANVIVAAATVVIIGFVISNYSLERFSVDRVRRSILASLIGMAICCAILGPVVWGLYAVGFIDHTFQWARDGFTDRMHPLLQRYGYLAAAGLPYGLVFGAALGLMIGVSRRVAEVGLRDALLGTDQDFGSGA